jgi:hypothetical protein
MRGSADDRRKYEEVAQFLNERGVYTSEDGEALFLKGDASSYYLEEVGNNEGPPNPTWKVVPE